jgi:hypothetical protein
VSRIAKTDESIPIKHGLTGERGTDHDKTVNKSSLKRGLSPLSSFFREIINKSKSGNMHIETSIQSRYERDFQKGCESLEKSINPDDKYL